MLVASPPAAVDAVPRSCSALVCAQDGRTPVLRAALAGNDTIVIQLATKMADVNLYLDLAALVDAMKDAAYIPPFSFLTTCKEGTGGPMCSAATAAAVVTLADSWKAKVRTAVDAFAKPKESGARKRWGKVVNRTKEAPPAEKAEQARRALAGAALKQATLAQAGLAAEPAPPAATEEQARLAADQATASAHSGPGVADEDESLAIAALAERVSHLKHANSKPAYAAAPGGNSVHAALGQVGALSRILGQIDVTLTQKQKTADEAVGLLSSFLSLTNRQAAAVSLLLHLVHFSRARSRAFISPPSRSLSLPLSPFLSPLSLTHTHARRLTCAAPPYAAESSPSGRLLLQDTGCWCPLHGQFA